MLAFKEASTFANGGSWRDHLWNVGSTGLLLMAGAGWLATGLTGWAGVGGGVIAETPSIAMNSFNNLALPGMPRS